MRTQWRTAARIITGPRGSLSLVIKTGLDYAPLRVVAEWLGIAPSAAALDGLRILEDESLRIYGERDSRALSKVK